MVTKLTSILEDAGSIPVLAQWIKEHGSDLTLLWLWCRPAAAALIRPLAWEFSYASGTALTPQKNLKTNVILNREI